MALKDTVERMKAQADRKVADLDSLIAFDPVSREHVRSALACAFASGTAELNVVHGQQLADYLEAQHKRIAGLK